MYGKREQLGPRLPLCALARRGGSDQCDKIKLQSVVRGVEEGAVSSVGCRRVDLNIHTPLPLRPGPACDGRAQSLTHTNETHDLFPPVSPASHTVSFTLWLSVTVICVCGGKLHRTRYGVCLRSLVGMKCSCDSRCRMHHARPLRALVASTPPIRLQKCRPKLQNQLQKQVLTC